MDDRLALHLRVRNVEERIRGLKHAPVTDLTALFGIERRAIQNHLPLFPRLKVVREFAVFQNCNDGSGTFEALITQKFALRGRKFGN